MSPQSPISPTTSNSGVDLQKSKRRLLDDYSTDEDNQSLPVQLVAIKKKKFIKTEDDCIPLPDPFPLPKNFRSDVEISLKSGNMTRESKSAFLSAVASAMLQYKKYPTKEDYICVARSIILKYPFMKSPTGATYVSPIV